MDGDTSLADFLPLKSLCNLLSSRPHIATAHRWSTRGVRGVRLRTYLVGGSRATTLADFDRFVAEVSAARDSTVLRDQDVIGHRNPPPDAAVPTTRSRKRDIAKAEQQLDRHGVNVDSADK